MPVAVAHNATPEGHAALWAALAWARVHGTSVLVLHVEETTSGSTRDTHASETGVHGVEREVAELLAAETEAPPEWRVVSTVSGGDVASALLDLVAEHGADLLVLGSRRRSAVGKLVMGSTVQRTLLDSTVPVLVVKAD